MMLLWHSFAVQFIFGDKGEVYLLDESWTVGLEKKVSKRENELHASWHHNSVILQGAKYKKQSLTTGTHSWAMVQDLKLFCMGQFNFEGRQFVHEILELVGRVFSGRALFKISQRLQDNGSGLGTSSRWLQLD